MTKSKHLTYRPDIDGLRAIAVLLVLSFHAFPTYVKNGFIGVDIFFVISGFLISTIILESLERNDFHFTEFYVKRIRRIFPALIIVLASCSLLAWIALFPDELQYFAQHVFTGSFFISNFHLLREASYFDNSAETKILLHLWSLSIEEQFYIVWPFVLWSSWKMKFNLLFIIFLLHSFHFYLTFHK